MITGKGTLVLRSGRRIALGYKFGSDFGDTRAGYLLCDTRSFDPGELGYRLTLNCDDGTAIHVEVMHYSDHHLTVMGRVLSPENMPAAA